MTFREGYRLERKYFRNLQTLIGTLKSWKGTEEDKGILSDILTSCIESNAAILLLYRNLGECYNVLLSLIEKDEKALEALKNLVEEYKVEINEKIDEVNNYLNSLIVDLQTRVENLEARVTELEERAQVYRLTVEPGAGTDYVIKDKDGTVLSFEDVRQMTETGFPYLVDLTDSAVYTLFLAGDESVAFSNITAEADGTSAEMDTRTYTYDSVTGIEYSEVTLSLAEIIANITSLLSDVANLQTDVENLETNKQDKLTAGTGIAIDPLTNEISATGGGYTAGSGITIDNTNTISLDAAYSQMQYSQDFGFTSPSWMTIALNTLYSGICYNHFCAEVEFLLNITTQGGLTSSATLGNISGTSLFGRILAGCSSYNKPDIYMVGRCVYDRNATLKDYALRFHPIFGGDFEIQYIGETMPYSQRDFDAAFTFTFPIANGGV